MGVCERTFRRSVDRYEEEGLDGLVDKRPGQVSARRAPVDEVMRTEALYRDGSPLSECTRQVDSLRLGARLAVADGTIDGVARRQRPVWCSGVTRTLF